MATDQPARAVGGPLGTTAAIWLRAYGEASRALAGAGGSAMRSLADPHSTDDSPTAADRATGRLERSVDRREAIEPGDTVRFTKRLTDGDVRAFAAASGDENPVHLDEAAASESRFGERIVHGVLVAGVISAALAGLPGRVIYLSQDLRFLAPVPVGATVVAECEVLEPLGDDRYRLRTVARTDDTDVIDGEAVVLIDPE